MLENLSEQVLDRLRRAEEAAERAGRAPNPSVRRDLLEMERRWLKLAHGYQFLEQFGVFTTYNKQRRSRTFAKAIAPQSDAWQGPCRSRGKHRQDRQKTHPGPTIAG